MNISTDIQGDVCDVCGCIWNEELDGTCSRLLEM